VTWSYVAADASGRERRGELRAETAAGALAQLRQQSLWVIELHPDSGPSVSARTTASGGWRQRAGMMWARWTGQDDESLAGITRVVSTLLAAGVPAERALDFAAQPDDLGGRASAIDQHWREVFGQVQRSVRDGRSMAEALASASSLPTFFAPSVAAAEATGALAQTFRRLAEALERRGQVAARVRSALVYPAVLGLSSIVGTLVILLVVVPRFAALLGDTGQSLPLSTQALVLVSEALTRGGWLLFPLIGVGAVLWQRRLRDPSRRAAWHERRLHWPLIGGFERQRDVARYLGTLALALDAGVSLLRAMELARATVGNLAYASRLAPAEGRVRNGESLVDALGSDLPPLARQLLQAGEAGGAMAPLAARAAEAADEAAERQLGRVVTLIEPVMILGFGGIVAFVALALLQAIYGLNANPL
jgi:general secretion pathway protein F